MQGRAWGEAARRQRGGLLQTDDHILPSAGRAAGVFQLASFLQ